MNVRLSGFVTGPRVVSRHITVESIKEVTEIVKRPVTIWDNLHANDYDQTRLYLGPYDGRPTELVTHLRGVLTNPNCEFEANFIAMHTLAQWSRNSCRRFPGECSHLRYFTLLSLAFIHNYLMLSVLHSNSSLRGQLW